MKEVRLEERKGQGGDKGEKWGESLGEEGEKARPQGQGKEKENQLDGCRVPVRPGVRTVGLGAGIQVFRGESKNASVVVCSLTGLSLPTGKELGGKGKRGQFI